MGNEPTGVLITSKHDVRNELITARLDRLEEAVEQLRALCVKTWRTLADRYDRDGDTEEAARCRATADEVERWAA